MKKKVLDHAPLIHAVIHLETSRCPDLKLTKEDVEETVQGKMIELGYPDYISSEHRIMEFNATPVLATDESRQREVVILRKVFRSGSQMDLVEVTENGIILKTTNYKSFEQFYKSFISILESVLEDVPQFQKALLKRIGLRYVDVVVPKPHRALRDYIQPEFLPASLSSLEHSNQVHGQMITRATTVAGSNITVALEELAVTEGTLRKILPENLGENDKRCAMKLNGHDWWGNPTSESYGILDIDHVKLFDDTPEMDLATVSSHLSNLYEATSDVFWSALTPAALDDWGCREIEMEGE